MGIDTGDDAAVYRLTDQLALVQTVDYFTPIVDDPYDFGAIAAANSLSDVYAMGGRPLTALNIVGFPSRTLPLKILARILLGGAEKCREAGCTVVGGHTIDDEEPKFGLAVTGLIEPGKAITNAAARPGDVLVLTKPLGTGIVATAIKRELADVATVRVATRTMATLNAAASEAALAVGVNACTDVTGFGLLGHLAGMCRGSRVGAVLSAGAAPVLPGVFDLIRKGSVPGGTRRNLENVARRVRWARNVPEELRLLLADAQTSGGLLLSVPAGRAAALVRLLEERGVPVVARLGEIVEDPDARIRVEP